MRFLVCNDDGYQAPGLCAIARALEQLGEVTVVAPDRDRSGASNSLTLDRPLRVMMDARGYHYINGTPTDCVHLAIASLLDHEPDMVISGINSGANLGDDVLYSGTVAAAIEGRFLGCPSVALSLAGEYLRGYDNAVQYALPLIKNLQEQSFNEPLLLNVNIPNLPAEDIMGYEVTRLGQRHKSEPVQPVHDPKGRKMYWVGPAGPEQDAGEGTDFHAISAHRVSITPLQIDCTAHHEIARVKSRLGTLL